MLKTLAIIGSGDLGQLIAYHASQSGMFNTVVFLDDYRKPGDYVCGYKIIGGTKDIETLFEQNKYDQLIIAIGYMHFKIRKSLFEKYNHKIPFATIIHPSAYVDSSCSIGSGTFILPGCVLDNNTTIGDNVLLNTGCTIAHDSIIKNHSFLSPRVAIAGFVKVGECCNIGINTIIIDNISITDEVQTGGGAVITKNITEPGLYVGVPAKKIK